MRATVVTTEAPHREWCPLEELRDSLAEPRNVTSSWKPVQLRAGLRVLGPQGNTWSRAIRVDVRGNLLIRAHDGSEMSIQRKDTADLIRALHEAAGDLTLIAFDGTEIGIQDLDRGVLVDRLEQEAARFSTGRQEMPRDSGKRDTGKMPPIGPEDPTPVIPVEPLLQFFKNLPYPSADPAVLKRYAELAEVIVMGGRPNPERTDALRKLVESMEAFFRSQRYVHHFSS